MAEAAAWARDKGMDFLGMLQEIYMKYGFSREAGISVVRPGKSGADEIVAMMKNFRALKSRYVRREPSQRLSFTLKCVATWTHRPIMTRL